jgi:hypothetical protein
MAQGEFITEAPPTPLETLENGEPKPIVMLIDFPQMVYVPSQCPRTVGTRFAVSKEVFCQKAKVYPKKWMGRLDSQVARRRGK